MSTTARILVFVAIVSLCFAFVASFAGALTPTLVAIVIVGICGWLALEDPF